MLNFHCAPKLESFPFPPDKELVNSKNVVNLAGSRKQSNMVTIWLIGGASCLTRALPNYKEDENESWRRPSNLATYLFEICNDRLKYRGPDDANSRSAEFSTRHEGLEIQKRQFFAMGVKDKNCQVNALAFL